LGSILLGYGLQDEVAGLHLPRHLLAREEVHPLGNPKPGPFIGEVGPDLLPPPPPAEGEDALRDLQGQKAPLAQGGVGLFEVGEALQEAEEIPVLTPFVPGKGGAAVGVRLLKTHTPTYGRVVAFPLQGFFAPCPMSIPPA